jgi:hypothetical protein
MSYRHPVPRPRLLGARRWRDLLSSNRELARRFAQLETRLDKKLTEHDEASAAL